MHVDTTDVEVRRLISSIAAVVEDEGGYVHPELVIHHDGPHLWVGLPRSENPNTLLDQAAHKPQAQAPTLLAIPAQVHVPMAGLTWAQDGATLINTASVDHLSQPQREVLAHMVDLFSVCQKVTAVAANYPRFRMEADPQLKALIDRARPGFPRDETSQTPVDALIRSRVAVDKPADPKTGEKSAGSFMPLIDMMNHHPFGSRYHLTDEGDRSVAVRHPNSSDQVYVRYNKMDALGCALSLGYSETATRFVASVSCQVEIDEGYTLTVIGVAARDRSIPAPVVSRTDTGIAASGLVLARGSLRRVKTLLGMPIQVLFPSAEPRRIDQIVDQLLIDVVQANLAYFRELAALCATADPPTVGTPLRPMFAAVADHQILLLQELASSLSPP